jgi:hypothetical protein
MSTWYRKSKRREDNIAGHKYGGKTELACVNGNITAIIHNDILLKRQCRNPGGSAKIPAFSKEARGCVPMDESCVSPVYFKKKKHNNGLSGIIHGCKIINLYLS